eukprot:scaffold40_cov66-Phaeocystis_antarctica.AAC.11
MREKILLEVRVATRGGYLQRMFGIGDYYRTKAYFITSATAVGACRIRGESTETSCAPLLNGDCEEAAGDGCGPELAYKDGKLSRPGFHINAHGEWPRSVKQTCTSTPGAGPTTPRPTLDGSEGGTGAFGSSRATSAERDATSERHQGRLGPREIAVELELLRVRPDPGRVVVEQRGEDCDAVALAQLVVVGGDVGGGGARGGAGGDGARGEDVVMDHHTADGDALARHGISRKPVNRPHRGGHGVGCGRPHGDHLPGGSGASEG